MQKKGNFPKYTKVIKKKFLEEYSKYATGHDMVFGGHCRLKRYEGKITPITGPFVKNNPDGIFSDFTRELAISALEESYGSVNCDSLFGLLLNNVEIGRDERTLEGEPDMRMRRAESMLGDFLLDVREEWATKNIPRNALSWFQIGEQWDPFARETHFRSLMDRRVGSLTKESKTVVIEENPSGKFYYYCPSPGRKYLLTSFTNHEKTEIFAQGAFCNGTGCAGEVSILLREAYRYRIRDKKDKYEPNVVYNLAPMICFQPVNIGTELAYDLFKIKCKTVNIFFDPNCEKMSVEVFEPNK
jgi:hypothetical protein